MRKEYRVWNHESPQGHYIIGNSPKQVIRSFILHSDRSDFPIHAMLWKTAKDLGSLKMTKQAIRFMHYHGDDKYTKFGRKYYKKDLK